MMGLKEDFYHITLPENQTIDSNYFQLDKLGAAVDKACIIIPDCEHDIPLVTRPKLLPFV